MRNATVFHDGGGGGVGPFSCAAVLYLVDDSRQIIETHERARDLGCGLTNNISEYEGLILALELARELGVTHLKIRSDSRLIVEQVLGSWRVKEAHLKPLHARALELAAGFEHVEIDWVRRERNRRSDELCREVLRSAAV